MSLLNDLNLTNSELQSVSPNLRDRITEKYAKLKGLQFLQAGQMFDRDSRRLDRKAHAVYRKMGLDMGKESDDDEIVLGDKVTDNSHGWLPAAIVAIAAVLIVGIMAWFFRPQSSPVGTDTDTKYQVGVGEPEPIDN